jgi:hypothetical protein
MDFELCRMTKERHLINRSQGKKYISITNNIKDYDRALLFE